MTGIIITAMGVSLLLTILFELLFALLLGIRGEALKINVLCNILTNPVVTCVYYICRYGFLWGEGSMAIVTAVLEISAVIAEWRVYKGWTDIKRPLLFSAGANCFSFFIGKLI
ncbi:MAG: hypothetical protein NC078_02825 [Ruminococcus sp.]|nr:hypothetical protein [Ruminococcus sp.]